MIAQRNLLYDVILLLFFLIGQLFASSIPDNMKGEIQELDKINKPEKQCDIGNSKVLCSKISDDFCDSLWSSSNEGNLSTSLSKFKLGYSPKSQMKLVDKLDLEAFINNQNRLPKALARKLKLHIKKLKEALAREKDSKPWYREITLLRWQIATVIEDYSREQTFKKHPELKNKRDKDLTIEEKSFFKEDTQDIDNIILDAKYKHSPKWKKIENIFNEAKTNLLLEISKMNLPESYKKRMYDKLQSVEISLPYTDPRILGAKEDCASNSENAFYNIKHNKLMICVGKINAIGSEASLYGTIAHELSHSVDPSVMATDNYYASEQAAIFNKMFKKKGQSFSCKQWEELKEKQFKLRDKMEKPKTPIDKLANCLMNKEGLKDFNLKNVRPIASRYAKLEIHELALRNYFTYLAQATERQGDLVSKNELYLRPDIMALRYDDYFHLDSVSKIVPISHVFVQSLLCRKIDGKKINLKDLSKKDRKKVFQEAVDETQSIIHSAYEEYFSYCGDECYSLVRSGLSKQSRENFADWLSFKAVARKLTDVKTIQNRRAFMAELGASYCSSGGIARDAPELTELERERYALTPYGEDRVRRLSAFTKKIAELIDCELDKDIQNKFAACEL